MSIPDLNFVLIHTEESITQGKISKDFQALSHMAKQFLSSAASKGVSTGLNAAHLGLGHVSMAFAPTISAIKVARSMSTTNKLYDLRDKNGYMCTCNKCYSALSFILNKREIKMAKIGISASVVGAPFVAAYDFGSSSIKFFKGIKGKERELYAKQLIAAAKPKGSVKQVVIPGKSMSIQLNIEKKGCPIAQATIAVLLKEPRKKGSEKDVMSYPKTIAAINANNSWLPLKKAMNP